MGDNKEGKKKGQAWVGFDLGGTKMMATVFDGDFAVLGRKRKKTRGYDGQKVGVERIIETINQALDEAHINRQDVAGIGIGCPGPVDPEKGIVLEAANLGWHNVDLRTSLKQAYDLSACVLNDVDAGVYAENLFGAAKGARTVVGIFPGTGIGGGCVYNGEIIQGKNISCMEIGHIEISAGGGLCGCEQRGCLETVASRLAISAEVAKAEFRGQIKKTPPRHRSGGDSQQYPGRSAHRWATRRWRKSCARQPSRLASLWRTSSTCWLPTWSCWAADWSRPCPTCSLTRCRKRPRVG